MPDRNSVLLGGQLGLLCNNVSKLQMNTVNCGLSLLAVRLEFSGLGLAKWSSLHRCLARPVLYITGLVFAVLCPQVTPADASDIGSVPKVYACSLLEPEMDTGWVYPWVGLGWVE